MFEIRIPDEVYKQAALAAEAQHLTVEEFVTEAVQLHLVSGDESIQRLFTPDRLKHIESADAEINAGKSFSAEQVDEHFAKKHRAWKLPN